MRHGQSQDEANQWYTGNSDFPLTEQGEQEAHHIGFRMHVMPCDVVYCGPFRRTYHTAKIVSKYLHAQLIVEDNLRDWNRDGVLTGLTYDQAHQHYPEELQKLGYYRSHACNGEKYNDFTKRVLEVFDRIIDSSYKHVAVVTHGNVIGAWLREKHGEFHHPEHLEHPDHIMQIDLNRKYRPEKIQSYFIEHA